MKSVNKVILAAHSGHHNVANQQLRTAQLGLSERTLGVVERTYFLP